MAVSLAVNSLNWDWPTRICIKASGWPCLPAQSRSAAAPKLSIDPTLMNNSPYARNSTGLTVARFSSSVQEPAAVSNLSC